MLQHPTNDDMASTRSKMQNTNSQLKKILMEGLSDNQWGYGIRRISVSVDKNIDRAFHHQIPYTFTSLGYKDEDGKWFVGLRMNVDQVSPLELRPMNENTNLTDAWADMMQEFVKEFVNKHAQ